MTTDPELDEHRLDDFERRLLAGDAVRVDAPELWRALAQAFPHRTLGPAERRLLLEALRRLEARGRIRLPSKRGRLWDRSMDPAVPTRVDLVRERTARSNFPWRTFPWYPTLRWVAQCRHLSAQQVEFLRRVHDGLVNGSFREPVPFKYRSLHLTGDEKGLALLVTTSLSGPSRLTVEMLGCFPDAVPLAWEAVGDGGRVVIFENAGPFAVARRVLGEMTARPYDLVAYGGGRTVLASLGHLKTIERGVESIHYVGDLDHGGLDIAWRARRSAKDLGLPAMLPASELHRQMLSAAEAFGHAHGWPAGDRFASTDRTDLLEGLALDVRHRINVILQAGRRIPEEVLGPYEFRRAWNGVHPRQRTRDGAV